MYAIRKQIYKFRELDRTLPVSGRWQVCVWELYCGHLSFKALGLRLALSSGSGACLIVFPLCPSCTRHQNRWHFPAIHQQQIFPSFYLKRWTTGRGLIAEDIYNVQHLREVLMFNIHLRASFTSKFIVILKGASEMPSIPSVCIFPSTLYF